MFVKVSKIGDKNICRLLILTVKMVKSNIKYFSLWVGLINLLIIQASKVFLIDLWKSLKGIRIKKN